MKRLIILSGAGISAESGIPTFRDAGGLWENHNLDDVCNINTFEKNYELVHQFYNARRTALSAFLPNLAHKKIAEISKEINVVNITTNIDDLFERAGCSDVLHLHGQLTRVLPKYMGEKNSEGVNVGYAELTKDYLRKNHPVKPAVSFFHEMVPEYQDLSDLIYSLTPKDVVIIVGSSEKVVPFSFKVANESSVYWDHQEPNLRPRLVFVNPDDSIPLPSCFERKVSSAVDYFESDEFIRIVNRLK